MAVSLATELRAALTPRSHPFSPIARFAGIRWWRTPIITSRRSIPVSLLCAGIPIISSLSCVPITTTTTPWCRLVSLVNFLLHCQLLWITPEEGINHDVPWLGAAQHTAEVEDFPCEEPIQQGNRLPWSTSSCIANS